MSNEHLGRLDAEEALFKERDKLARLSRRYLRGNEVENALAVNV